MNVKGIQVSLKITDPNFYNEQMNTQRNMRSRQESKRIPEEGGDIMVKRVADNGVHDVEKQYGQLSTVIGGCGGAS